MDVADTAKKVRRDFESCSVDPIRLEELYSRYNSIPDIEDFISQAIKQFPVLACGVASVYLQDVFHGGSIVQGRYLEHDHTFLKLDGNVIIDVTADQYGGPAVYVGKLVSPWSLSN